MDPFIDSILEPSIFAIFYGAYVAILLPTIPNYGFLFAIIQALKPLQTVWVLYLPYLMSVAGLTDFVNSDILLTYFIMEAVVTIIPSMSFVGASAFAAI